MQVYNRADLLFDDYDWTESQTLPKLQGNPDRNLYKRFEGNQVLYIINYTCNIMNCKTKTDASRMELLLHEKLPFDVKSQSSVFAWLMKTFTVNREELD